MPENMTAGVYHIGIVCQLTGLTERQVRYYDQKGLLTPQRTRGNQRLYSPQDVERLGYIKRFLQRGMRIKEVREILEQRDHERLERERRGAVEGALADGKLRSLYPLQNRAELLKALGEMKKT